MPDASASEPVCSMRGASQGFFNTIFSFRGKKSKHTGEPETKGNVARSIMLCNSVAILADLPVESWSTSSSSHSGRFCECAREHAYAR